ncbi:MAG: hypothetical protein AAFX87_28540 [Bacteroidota bacterium]
MKKTSAFGKLIFGVLCIICFVWVAPKLRLWLVPKEMRQKVEEKTIDTSALFYTESDISVPAGKRLDEKLHSKAKPENTSEPSTNYSTPK